MRQLLGVLLAALAMPAMAQTINTGSVRTLSDVPLYIAEEKGYFKEVGISVNVSDFPSAATMVALCAKGELPIIGGAISVGYFNSLAQGLPLKIVADRAQYPAYHNIMVRPDLKDTIKKPADLKGRSVGMVARGSIVEYEVGKILESAGLTLKDIDIKYIPFPQTGIAFENKAIDAATLVPPFVELLESKNMAVRWIDPVDAIQPRMQIGALIANSEWAEKNRALMQKFMVAWMRGMREYVRAARGGPNRAEIVALMMRRTEINDAAMLDRMKWISIHPDGAVFTDSLSDVQDFFMRAGLIQKKFSTDELVDMSFVNYAVQQLGPYKE